MCLNMGISCLSKATWSLYFCFHLILLLINWLPLLTHTIHEQHPPTSVAAINPDARSFFKPKEPPSTGHSTCAIYPKSLKLTDHWQVNESLAANGKSMHHYSIGH